MATTLTDALLGARRITVRENQRALVFAEGRFEDILSPGEHVFYDAYRNRFTFEFHDLNRPEFTSTFEHALFQERRDLADKHLTEIITGPDEVGVIERDGRIYGVQKPDGRTVLWTAAGPWSVTRVNIVEALEVEPKLARRLERMSASDKIANYSVAHGYIGLLYVDGEFHNALEPGRHMFWSVGRRLELKQIDLRRRSLDVTGQEILTKDRVSIRVNLAAEYRVTDAIKAVTEVNDFSDSLHRALQYAFRKTLGAMSFDEILEKKVSVDAEAAQKVRAEMAQIGVEVGEIALKDVILPGEMREILNQVVQAEKEAQANVIRRREETAATRSLLNTARVMEENPIMLRLKELEALESIAGKVESLVVHNGPKGLMSDIAKLSD